MGPGSILPSSFSLPSGLLPECKSSTTALPVASQGKLKFAKDTAGFLPELRKRVDAFLKETGRRANDCWQMYLKSAIIVGTFLVSWTLLVFYATTWWQVIPLATMVAVSMALVGFCIMHDGGHQGYSKYRWVNKLAAISLDVIGVSSYLWYWKHAIFHHTYCNVQGHDTDIDVSSLARFSPHVRRKKIHYWQHLYLWALYGLMASRWHIYGDFKDVATGTIGPHKIQRPRGWDLVIFLGGKVISYSMLLVIPMFYHDWWLVLLVYMYATAILGIILSIVFQLAHCVEEAEFPMPPEGSLHMESAWAIHQVETTIDFSRKSWLACWLLGGLNFQIEHHLFPKICHINYPAISPIVEQTCKEFGIQFVEHPSFWAGVVSHYRWLKRMGRHDNADGTNVNSPPATTTA